MSSKRKVNDNAVTAKKKSNYLEYCQVNLDTLKDSRGGFLTSAETSSTKSNPKTVVYEPAIPMLPSDQKRCQDCKSLSNIDYKYHTNFDIIICKTCIKNNPELYSLLTKTEVKTDYLLTEPELASPTFHTLLKKNPHNSTYSSMILYLRKEVEDFVVEKYGSLEKLDEEFEARVAKKKKLVEKKYEKKLKELRVKTRSGILGKERTLKNNHVHVYGKKTRKIGTVDEYVQSCTECGIEIEFDEF